VASAIGLAAGAYLIQAGAAWQRYGHPRKPSAAEEDALLDQFIPVYEVVERHHVHVAAPAHITLAAAREQDLQSSSLVRAIFKARALVLGSAPDRQPRPRPMLELVQSLGWGLLAEVAGREVVVGAVTRPWEADVKFRAIPPTAFAGFWDPGYVKIAWTLRVDPVAADGSVFRTETRAVSTDPYARALFRRYWSFVSPGVGLIRWLSLGPLKADAERRARAACTPPSASIVFR
jgi:hypothetical protein